MNRHLLLAAFVLLLTCAPAFAQSYGTMGVYWNPEGTYLYPSQANDSGGGLVYRGYVVLFVEDVVRGAAFRLDFRSNEALIGETTYPAGLQIGEAWNRGIEIGFTEPYYGFLTRPMVMCEFLVINDAYPEMARFDVGVYPHPDYGAAVYADGEERIVAVELMPVGNEAMSFGDVKSLFR